MKNLRNEKCLPLKMSVPTLTGGWFTVTACHAKCGKTTVPKFKILNSSRTQK